VLGRGRQSKMPTPKRSRKIIVNVDDFGMSAEVNRAIVEAFENNVISDADGQYARL
jgi:hypothetical protein